MRHGIVVTEHSGSPKHALVETFPGISWAAYVTEHRASLCENTFGSDTGCTYNPDFNSSLIKVNRLIDTKFKKSNASKAFQFIAHHSLPSTLYT